MNTELFIAKRISFEGSQNFTKVIVGIAITAIALSLSIMIVTTSVITGFKKDITEKIIAFWGDIHIHDTNLVNSAERIPIDNASVLMREIDSIAYIEYEESEETDGTPYFSVGEGISRTKGGVLSVQGTAELPGLLRTKDQNEGILLKGIGRDYDFKRMEPYIEEGSMLSLPDSAASPDILVSQSTARRLKLQVGQKVIMSFIKDQKHRKRSFQICGFYNTGLEEYDSKIAIIDIRKIQQLLGWTEDQVGVIEVLIEEKEDLEVLSQYIYYDMLPSNLYAEPITQKFPNIFQWLSLQDFNERLILWLMIIVGVINMITVLIILILERTRMIGVLKALGMQAWNIRKVFIYNAGFIILMGLLIGNIIGIGFCLLQKYYPFITLDEKSYYLSVAPIEFNVPLILIINVAIIAIILLVMIIPTMIIDRISPIKVLRFE